MNPRRAPLYINTKTGWAIPPCDFEEPKERAAFHTVLKRRPRVLLYLPVVVQKIRQLIAIIAC